MRTAGVQTPHCAAPCACKAERNCATIASSSPRPSIVSIEHPSACPTGANRLTVDEHRTGSAIPGVAADLDASEATLLAQDETEAFDRRSGNARRFSVEGQRDAGRAFEHQTTPPAWRSAQASIARLSNVNAASRR